MLCRESGGVVLLKTDAWRIVLADNEPLHPATCRVIWNAHVREMTDLAPAARAAFIAAVMHAEQAVRAVLQPFKINLASLGNVTPHLHWHVVPRWEDDAHFPNAIWGPARRDAQPRSLSAAQIEALRAQLETGA